jgi:hypothetical protein
MKLLIFFKRLLGLLQVLGFLVLILTLAGMLGACALPEGPRFYGVPVFVPGLIVGAAMAAFLPYLKEGLQKVAETGRWGDFPTFNAKYLALFALPFLEFGAWFLTTEGLWESACGWPFIHAVLLAYSGADLGKQVSKAALALVQIAGAGKRP